MANPINSATKSGVSVHNANLSLYPEPNLTLPFSNMSGGETVYVTSPASSNLIQAQPQVSSLLLALPLQSRTPVYETCSMSDDLPGPKQSEIAKAHPHISRTNPSHFSSVEII